jgi:hypothetical protein
MLPDHGANCGRLHHESVTAVKAEAGHEGLTYGVCKGLCVEETMVRASGSMLQVIRVAAEKSKSRSASSLRRGGRKQLCNDWSGSAKPVVGCSRAQFDRVTRAHEILISTPRALRHFYVIVCCCMLLS